MDDAPRPSVDWQSRRRQHRHLNPASNPSTRRLIHAADRTHPAPDGRSSIGGDDGPPRPAERVPRTARDRTPWQGFRGTDLLTGPPMPSLAQSSGMLDVWRWKAEV